MPVSAFEVSTPEGRLAQPKWNPKVLVAGGVVVGILIGLIPYIFSSGSGESASLRPSTTAASGTGNVKLAVGQEFTNWFCACRQEKVNANNAHQFLITTDESICNTLLPYTTQAADLGRSCIAKEAARAECRSTFQEWWKLAVGPSNPTVEKLRQIFARELQNYPLRKWVNDKKEVTQQDFLGFLEPRCTEIVLRLFAGEIGDQPGGDTYFQQTVTEVFGAAPEFELKNGGNAEESEKFLKLVTFGDSAPTELVPIKVGKYEFKEHPGFSKFRKNYEIPDDFLKDFHAESYKEGMEEGGSGAKYFRFNEFFIKWEIASDWHAVVDWRFLHNHAEDYFKYMLEVNKDSFLSRMYTAYFDDGSKTNAKPGFYFVMQHNLPALWGDPRSAWRQHHTGQVVEYDLKGSRMDVRKGRKNGHTTGGRVVSFEGRKWKEEATGGKQILMKDLNLVFSPEKLLLTEDLMDKVQKGVQEDVKWLQERLVVDYSLFTAVIKAGDYDAATSYVICPCDSKGDVSDALKAQTGKCEEDKKKIWSSFYQSTHGLLAVERSEPKSFVLYSIGIIDLLNPWTLFRALGTAHDRLMFTSSTDRQMNNISPDSYAKRLNEAVGDYFASDNGVTEPACTATKKKLI